MRELWPSIWRGSVRCWLRLTSRCSGRSRRREIGVTSTNRSCGGLAAERQGVRRATTAGWGSEPERVGQRGRGWQLGKSICPAHRRDSCHLEGSIEASVECLVVGNEVVVVNSASTRRDLVEDLEVELERRGSGSGIGVERSPCRRTSRCSGRGPFNSRSVFNEPGPRGSTDDRRTPRGPGSAAIDHHLTAHAAERQGVGRTERSIG